MELAELLQGAGLADGVVACAAEALSEHGFPPLAQLVDLPHSDLERLLALGVGRVCVPAFAQHVILEHAAVQRATRRRRQLKWVPSSREDGVRALVQRAGAPDQVGRQLLEGGGIKGTEQLTRLCRLRLDALLLECAVRAEWRDNILDEAVLVRYSAARDAAASAAAAAGGGGGGSALRAAVGGRRQSAGARMLGGANDGLTSAASGGLRLVQGV